MYIAKYKLFVVDNSITWDGEPSPEGSPTFRIEFESERIYTGDKVTPVNAGEAEHAQSNKDKLFEMGACVATFFSHIFHVCSFSLFFDSLSSSHSIYFPSSSFSFFSPSLPPFPAPPPRTPSP